MMVIGGGYIINIVFVVGLWFVFMISVYSVFKYGVVGFIKLVVVEYVRVNICINVVCLSFVDIFMV